MPKVIDLLIDTRPRETERERERERETIFKYDAANRMTIAAIRP